MNQAQPKMAWWQRLLSPIAAVIAWPFELGKINKNSPDAVDLEAIERQDSNTQGSIRQ